MEQREREVVEDRQREEQTLLLAIARHVDDAVPLRVACVADTVRLSALEQRDGAGRGRAHARDDLRKLDLTVSLEAG